MVLMYFSFLNTGRNKSLSASCAHSADKNSASPGISLHNITVVLVWVLCWWYKPYLDFSVGPDIMWNFLNFLLRSRSVSAVYELNVQLESTIESMDGLEAITFNSWEIASSSCALLVDEEVQNKLTSLMDFNAVLVPVKNHKCQKCHFKTSTWVNASLRMICDAYWTVRLSDL